MRRLVLLLIMAGLALGLWAGGASAALGLLFSRSSAEPGDEVRLRTAGRGAFLQPKRRGELRRRPVRVFLARQSDAASIRTVRDRRLTLLGRLNVDRRGDGRLRFRTPNLPPGAYAAVVHCPACARYSGGRTLFAGDVSKPFRIRPVLRDCRSSVYGDLGAHWQRNAVQAGPVWFVGLRGYGPQAFAPHPTRRGRYDPVKVLLVVQNGVTVTLSVPADAWGTFGLVYDPSLFNRRWIPIRSARYSMTFEGCAPNPYDAPHTQFNGSLVAAGARCAPLEVTVAGGETRRYQIPLGRAC